MYHFRVKVIGRSKGGSAAGAMAYRTGGRSPAAAIAYRIGGILKDPRTGQSYDYRAKGRVDENGYGVLHTEVLAPANAPAWTADPQQIVNRVEGSEKRSDAQLLRELEISLPRELSLSDQIALVRRFVQAECVRRGMVAIIAVHNERASDGGDNPHVHVLLTMRKLQGEEFGTKERTWNDRRLVQDWREAWADHANDMLAARGLPRRLDHRSLREQGLDVEPDINIGPGAKRGFEGIIIDDQRRMRREVRARNRARAENAEWLLEQITRLQSTFTENDITAFLQRHAGLSFDDPESEQLRRAALASAQTLAINSDQGGPTRYTTRAVFEREVRMAKIAQRLAARQSASITVSSLVGLSEAQRQAAIHLLQGPALTALEGAAGSGKSYLLNAVRGQLEQNGYRVRGAALSALVACSLEEDAGMPAVTLHLMLKDLARPRPLAPLAANDVVVVDEAGLIGSRQMEELLAHVERAGARVMLVGDSRQLQSIEAGAAFRALVEQHGAARLDEIRRQQEPWQREATNAFAQGRAADAVALYQSRGAMHAAESPDEALRCMVEAWAEARSEHETQIMLAHRRADAALLNRAARARLREMGLLGPDVSVQVRVSEDTGGQLVEHPEWRKFAEGDQIMFTKNDRVMGIQNGAVGHIKHIAGSGVMQVENKDGRLMTIDPSVYPYLEQGYALTVHKAQGVTVDRAFVYASGSFDSHLSYVALTRHRRSVDVFYSRDEFEGPADLKARLTRDRTKDISTDYATSLSRSDQPQQDTAPLPSLAHPKTREQKRREAALALLEQERAERERRIEREYGRE